MSYSMFWDLVTSASLTLQRIGEWLRSYTTSKIISLSANLLS